MKTQEEYIKYLNRFKRQKKLRRISRSDYESEHEYDTYENDNDREYERLGNN